MCFRIVFFSLWSLEMAGISNACALRSQRMAACHHALLLAARARYVNVKSVYPTMYIINEASESRSCKERSQVHQESGYTHELVNWIRGYMHLSCAAQTAKSFASVPVEILWYTWCPLTLAVIINSPITTCKGLPWCSSLKRSTHDYCTYHASPQRLISMQV